LRESAIICGIEYAQNAFLSLDKNIQIEWQLNDGDRMDKNQILCIFSFNMTASYKPIR
jgi:nicotinate-nucleotide pyrophosphorylase (carboxylating)